MEWDLLPITLVIRKTEQKLVVGIVCPAPDLKGVIRADRAGHEKLVAGAALLFICTNWLVAEAQPRKSMSDCS